MPNQDAVFHRLAIVDNLRAYAYAVDDRNFAAARDLFTRDAVLDYTSSGGPRGTRDEVIDWIEQGLAQVGPTQHLVCNELVRFPSQGATSRCYLFNPLLTPEDPPGLLFVGGEYHDTWRQTPKGWHIVERRHLVTWTRRLP